MKPFLFCIPDKQIESLRRLSSETGLSIAELLIMAIDSFIEGKDNVRNGKQ